MALGIRVVFHIARGERVDGVITTHAAVFAGKPFGATLAEDDISRNHELVARFFCTETLAWTVFWAVVCAALASMGGITHLKLGSEDGRAGLGLGMSSLLEDGGNGHGRAKKGRTTGVASRLP